MERLVLISQDNTRGNKDHTQLIEFANNEYIIGLVNTHKPAIHIIIKVHYHYGTRDYHNGKIVHVTYDQTRSEITTS